MEFRVFSGFYPPEVFTYGFLVGYGCGRRDAVGSRLVGLVEFLSQVGVNVFN